MSGNQFTMICDRAECRSWVFIFTMIYPGEWVLWSLCGRRERLGGIRSWCLAGLTLPVQKAPSLSSSLSLFFIVNVRQIPPLCSRGMYGRSVQVHGGHNSLKFRLEYWITMRLTRVSQRGRALAVTAAELKGSAKQTSSFAGLTANSCEGRCVVGGGISIQIRSLHIPLWFVRFCEKVVFDPKFLWMKKLTLKDENVAFIWQNIK